MTSSDLWTVFLLWSGFDLHEKTVGNARLLEIRKWNEYNPILSEPLNNDDLNLNTDSYNTSFTYQRLSLVSLGYL